MMRRGNKRPDVEGRACIVRRMCCSVSSVGGPASPGRAGAVADLHPPGYIPDFCRTGFFSPRSFALREEDHGMLNVVRLFTVIVCESWRGRDGDVFFKISRVVVSRKTRDNVVKLGPMLLSTKLSRKIF